MKRAAIAGALLLIALATNAIIYRHDVPEEKFRQLGEQPQFDCVGKVLDGERHVASGSCVLIDDRYVLSAAHLFVKNEIRNDTIRSGNQRIIIYQPVNRRLDDITKYHFRFNRIKYAAKRMKTFPAYLDSATRGQFDIVLIELDQPVTSCKPTSLCATFDELNSLATMVGYGTSGKANKPQEVDEYGYKLAGQNMIDTLQGYYYNNHPAILGFDFDHPDKPEYNVTGSNKPVALESLCGGGDSGGGMFRQRKNGEWELIGICTGSGTDLQRLLTIGYYGNSGEYTRVSVFYAWLQKEMAAMRAARKQ